MPVDSPAKRATCMQCRRALRACICRWVAPVENQVEVVILQHPLEAGQAKGSASLLDMSLANSKLAVGELFTEPTLHALLHDAGDTRQPLLLYPDVPGLPVGADAAAHSALSTASRDMRLVILDGTWRKSRKMLYLNPMLQSLPRLALRDLPPSQYHIRKAHGIDQLSTLEAACYALGQLEGDDAKYAPLLRAFDAFVAQQAAFAKAPFAKDGLTSD